jgi:acetoin utilization deacetylase AcuC-like enzyme
LYLFLQSDAVMLFPDLFNFRLYKISKLIQCAHSSFIAAIIQKQMFGYVSDEKCFGHMANGPEVPKRWQVLNDTLIEFKKNHSYWKKLDVAVEQKAIECAIKSAHSEFYLKKAIRACEFEQFITTREVEVCRKSIDAAYAGVGAMLTALNHVVENKEHKDGEHKFIFCNSRPPGHHSGYNATSGFCVFNNVAIGAIYAVKQLGIKHVAIFDFDVHFGDGTVDILQARVKELGNAISFYSIHQSECFPNTAASNTNKDTRTNIYNRCLKANCTLSDYMIIFEELLAIMKTHHQPDLIIVSCGFDSCINETIAQFPLRPETYKELTRKLLEVCPRMISNLEGGYELDSIGKCLQSHLEGVL